MSVEDTKENIFIDRDEELVELRERLDILESEGKGSVTILAGEAGIGKTFLVKRMRGLAEKRGFRWLDSVCISRDAEPFQPLKESFNAFMEEKKRPYLNLPISIRMAYEKDDPGDVDNIFKKSDRATIQRAMEFVKNITDTTPMVLFMEDMHLADRYTLLFVRYLSNNIGPSNIVLICAYRPEDAVDHEFLKETLNFMYHRKLHREIHLEPFDRDDTRELIDAVTGDEAPDDFVELFHRSTEGNPLYIYETLRSMLANKIIDPTQGRYLSDGDSIDWPPVVRYTVDRKITRLDDSVKNFLQYISILGPQFSFPMIAEYINMDEMDVLDMIDALLEVNILTETGGSEWYRFSHQAVKDILQEGQSTGKKRLLHKKAAEAIKKCYGRDLSVHHETLGHHYESAVMYDMAAEYYYKAGRHHEKKGDTDRAIDNYLSVERLSREQNLMDMESKDYLERAGDLMYGKGTALLDQGEDTEGRELIRRAMKVFERAGMEDRTKECRKHLGDVM